ncbi:MAG: Histidine triad protein [Parcubacteria group bacterium GW2011_GWA2_47_7]|nr:MAG: Histidine triad protein [Parcubacteria group bacterium GW2011_GWA2_47_7]
MENDCLFCKIIKGEIPSHKIYEDESTYAFLDIHPINRGHTLVVPKEHHENIYDTPSEVFQSVMKTVHLLASKIKQAIGSEGINIGINNERAAGQLVFHLHAHIIPRWSDDGHMHWHGNPYQTGEIETIKDIITQEFK